MPEYKVMQMKPRKAAKRADGTPFQTKDGKQLYEWCMQVQHVGGGPADNIKVNAVEKTTYTLGETYEFDLTDKEYQGWTIAKRVRSDSGYGGGGGGGRRAPAVKYTLDQAVEVLTELNARAKKAKLRPEDAVTLFLAIKDGWVTDPLAAGADAGKSGSSSSESQQAFGPSGDDGFANDEEAPPWADDDPDDNVPF